MHEIYEARTRRYRIILYILLAAGLTVLLTAGYFRILSRIPSTIMVKAGVDEELDWQLPISGELYRKGIDQQEEQAVMTSALPVNFAKPVTIRAKQVDRYCMELRLFGVVPLKNVDVEIIPDMLLRPAGIPVGIYVETEGILVAGVGSFEGELGNLEEPAKDIFQTGDYILEVNDCRLESKKQLTEEILHCEGQPLVFKLRRGENELYVKAQPALNQNGEYKLGVWVRDNAQGVGTMTYMDEQGRFGALGHGINDIDTGTLMNMGDGRLYHTEIIGITRGSSGNPGELTGFIEYDDRNIMGTITDNTVRGVFGECSSELMENNPNEFMELCLKQDIELGPAQIICSLGGGSHYYEVEILEVNIQNDHMNRGIVLEVTDEELLATTGGIVQGMSGSPIIQNGKIVGAVTHVLVNDPTRGYGIFIENMLEH